MIKETTHLISHYNEAEAALAEQFITFLEERYEEIQKAFQFKKATQRYTFRLCSSVEEYIIATGKTREEYQDWMVGHSNADTYTICLLSPNASEEAANQDMDKVAVMITPEFTYGILFKPMDLKGFWKCTVGSATGRN